MKSWIFALSLMILMPFPALAFVNKTVHTEDAEINFQDSLIRADYDDKDNYGGYLPDKLSSVRGLSIRAAVGMVRHFIDKTRPVTVVFYPQTEIVYRIAEGPKEKALQDVADKEAEINRYHFKYDTEDIDRRVNQLLKKNDIVLLCKEVMTRYNELHVLIKIITNEQNASGPNDNIFHYHYTLGYEDDDDEIIDYKEYKKCPFEESDDIASSLLNSDVNWYLTKIKRVNSLDENVNHSPSTR